MSADTPAALRESFRQQLAELIAGHGPQSDELAALAMSPPLPPRYAEAETSPAPNQPAVQPPEAPARQTPTPPSSPAASPTDFVPLEPESLARAGVTENQIEALLLKFLANCSTATGRETSEQIRLPFGIIRDLLRKMKDDRLVIYKGAAPMADYVYELTELGLDRARRHAAQCSYFGSAPVSLADYAASVHAQSIRKRHPTLAELRRALSDLLLSDELIGQLGQAVWSGLGLFLFGPPGNGKTSIAERVTKAFGETIWIPRAVSVLGEIIRLYDPMNHEALPEEPPTAIRDRQVDRRWLRIRRPTIMVGGELRMESLELTVDKATGLSEAPLQMKSNGGTLVIDDFGRQRITPAELLNRWIVPLEKRYDYLNLASGRKTQVPFDQLVIFSTNLEPRDLVDEAFLRRIPYKIDVRDPTDEEFHDLFRRTAAQAGVEYHREPIERMLQENYKLTGRPLRFCHPRDLIHQIQVFCAFHGQPPAITIEALRAAVKNYFAMM